LRNLLFVLCLIPTTFSTCQKVIGDPYGESFYYLKNNRTNTIQAKSIAITQLDSIKSTWLIINSADIGYFGMASGMGSPNPNQILSKILIANNGDTTNLIDTIAILSDSLWIRTFINNIKTKWVYIYE